MATTTIMHSHGDLFRMSDTINFEEEYSTLNTLTTSGTPRPRMNTEDISARQDAAVKAIMTFSQAAKQYATANKRRRTQRTSTHYFMAVSFKVASAFDELQKQIEKYPSVMSQDDFNILKQAIGNFRVKCNVHDNKTLDDLKKMLSETRKLEAQAELDIHNTLVNKSQGEPSYIDAKDRYLDLKTWGNELEKEIHTISIVKPGGIHSVPSQHAQISPATGILLRNILTPETIRRTFISLNTLTSKIRNEVVLFLTDAARHKDRHEVIKQIKECVISSKKNTDAH